MCAPPPVTWLRCAPVPLPSVASSVFSHASAPGPACCRLLLDVKQPDKTEEASLQKELTARYAASDKTNPELVKQVRGAIRRYQPEMEFFRSSRVQDVMERWE